MANFSIKEDLLKLQGAFVTNFKGRTATKKCLVIPVEESGLFVGEKGVYLSLAAIEMENPKYSETHFVKVSVDKDKFDKMPEEERKAIPIIGGLKPMEAKQAPQMKIESNTDASQIDEGSVDDLPF